MAKSLIIGTRDSQLALWQAETIQRLLAEKGFSAILKKVKSTGDLNLDQPLYEMGITGIFTKTLDVALINDEIDIAVHSMKDVPTQLPKTIVEGAIIDRATHLDVLIPKSDMDTDSPMTIATGSLRRKAQWLHQYPHHRTENIRGNVQTRMRKLHETDHWKGAIFAKAGLERIDMLPDDAIELDWMLAAPAQGAILSVTREQNELARNALKNIHQENVAQCVHQERAFLRRLEGGCTAPIGAFAEVKNEKMHFHGNLTSLDGKQYFEVKKAVDLDQAADLGKNCADEILAQGGDELMKQLREIL